jgi:hydroxymethylbilane synthase
MKLRLSSRQSALAQVQAYQVGHALELQNPDLQVDYHFRESLGDKNLTDPLWKMPEKGVFTEDFFQDLVEMKTELVVHSWKDLPTEIRPQTCIAATLPRADQRDLLLFKKTSLKKSVLKIFSSSPRRAFNIKPFLNWALPWKTESIEFQSVRGNIPTRVQKLLEANEIDGLILAKAALDRLLVDVHFPETATALRKALQKLDWMVLPLTENPNAAAQGALAIEISTSRPDVESLVKKINCEATFQSAERERAILREFGGGCHLALGMSVLERSFGRIEIVKGLTPDRDHISSKKFYPKIKRPSNTVGRLEFRSHRETIKLPARHLEALFVAKAEAMLGSSVTADIMWVAGLQTWKKLAAKGFWIHGSSEGLGDAEESRIAILVGHEPEWSRMTHDEAPTDDEKKNISGYKLKLELVSTQLGEEKIFQWKSSSEFLLAIQHFPELKNRMHICGPGRTFESIKKFLISHGIEADQNIFVELGDEFITVI